MFLDVHTHKAAVTNSIQSHYNGFDVLPPAGYHSVGLHPWHINQQWKYDFEKLAVAAAQKSIMAVGECGLDKVCTADFSLQQTVFAAQVQLANSINKPLIIHCVKAFDEVLQVLQQQQNKVPVIFHGFNKSKQLAKQLYNNGYYLSFGKALQQPKMLAVLKMIPADKFFLETDDDAIAIDELYSLAATILQIDINTLSLQLQKNAITVFGTDFLNV